MKKILLAVFISFFVITWVGFSENFYRNYEQYDKVIRINTYANMLSYYENWEKINQFETSVGAKENYTPRWRFRIQNKAESMYSQAAGKFMPYRIEFWQDDYWIHALPQDHNGDLDTEAEIGSLAQWWCVRLTKDDAKKLYEWAELGTVVLIDYDPSQYNNPEEDKQVIKNYFEYINNQDYAKALDLKLNNQYGVYTLRSIYQWLEVEVQEIRERQGSEYIVESDIYHNNNLITNAISVFQISNGKIRRSYTK